MTETKLNEHYESKYKLTKGISTFLDEIPGLVKSGMKFGNARDAIEGRLEKYNSNKKDRDLLIGNGIWLPGNPVFVERNEKGKIQDLILVYDLENPDLDFVKKIISELRFGGDQPLRLNSEKNLIVKDIMVNRSQRDFYYNLRNADGTFIVDAETANDFSINPYKHPEKRKIILEALCQHDKCLAEEYIKFVKGYKTFGELDSILGVSLYKFPRGMSFLELESVGRSKSNLTIGSGLSYLGQPNVLGINPNFKKDNIYKGVEK
jgi:hypothetical protein